MARGVTLMEFHDFVNKFKAKTWNLEAISSNDPGKYDVKYFDIAFDTRFMNIYRIEARNYGKVSVVVHVGDDRDQEGFKTNERTVLDLLIDKLGWNNEN